MASDCKSLRKEKGKWRKERKWEDQTSPNAGSKALKIGRQAGRRVASCQGGAVMQCSAIIFLA